METTITRDSMVIAFRDDVQVWFDGESVALEQGPRTFTLRRVDEGIRAALRRLADGPTSVSQLHDLMTDRQYTRLVLLLARVGHLIVRGVVAGGRELVRMEHTALDADPRPADVPDNAVLRLSRFAFCRSRDGVLVLESPLAKVRVLLVHPAARELVSALGAPHTLAELGGPGLDVKDATAVLPYLVGAGLVEVATESGRFPSEADPTLRQWDFHDLLFHSRIRAGRYDDPIGGIFPHRGTIDPEPAVKQLPAGPVIELYRPTLDEIAAHDPGLTVALEARRSIRQYGETPLTLRELGEFLYRVHRVRVLRTSGDPSGNQIVGRPYPTGGSAYEIELYLTVRRCVGLDPGIYYHDPVAHRLILVNPDPVAREAMLSVAVGSTGMEADADVLITLTSRFQRLSWKYAGIAYGMTLRHCGVVYQTMYLVATAMGLAPCGLGIGDADLAARSFRLDYLRESSVGDFLLGSRPSGDLGSWQADDGWHLVNDPEWALEATRELRARRSPGPIM